MRAVAFTEFGGPDVLRVMDLPMPAPGADDVVVRVAAATVNPTDTMMRAGRQAANMVGLAPPWVAGMEFAGHVHATGANVKSVAVRQRVMGIVNPRRPAGGGAQQEYLCIPAASVVAIPESMDLAEAATVPMNGLTAIMVLEDLALGAGQSVLVTGGPGALGGYVIQLAARAGLRVIADASDADADLLRGFGATVIVPRGEGMADAVRRVAPAGVDGVADCALLGPAVAPLVKAGGVAVAVRRTHPVNDARLRQTFVSVPDRVTDTAALEQLAGFVRGGVLTMRVGARLPIEEAGEAHRRVEQGGQRGRIVLMF